METRVRYFVYFALMIAIVVAAVEGISYAGLWWLAKYRDIHYQPLLLEPLSPFYQRKLRRFIAGKSPISVYSRSLGWEPAPNTSLTEGAYRTNSAGMRHVREFSPVPPDGTTRIVTFGDSFTEGIEVSNPNTWQEQLMAMDGGLEVLNFGVGGYGPDQAYLRYRERVDEYRHDVVMLGYMTENLHRVVNVYIPYYVGELAGAPVTKPRFVSNDGKLVLIPNPMQRPGDYRKLLNQPEQVLPRLGKYDYYYNSRYQRGVLDSLGTVRLAKIAYYQARSEPIATSSGEYNTGSDAFRVTMGVFEAFFREALDNDTVPVVVIYPSYWDVIRLYQDGSRSYQPLLDRLDADGYLYLDLLEGVVELGKDHPIRSFFVSRAAHYSRFGNELVAKVVQALVNDRQLWDPRVRQSLIAQLRDTRSAQFSQ